MKMSRIALMGSLLALCCAAPAFAQPAPKPDFRLCTGMDTGNYYRAGQHLKRHSSAVKLDVIQTDGSIDNLDRITRGECDGGFVQSDALLVYSQRNAAAISALERSGILYQEHAHLLCNRDAGIKRVVDLNEKITISVGPDGSGARTTWQAFVLADKKRYERVRLDDRAGVIAFSAASDGADIQCVLWVGALGAATMKHEASRYGDRLVLVGTDDGDMDGAKDSRGKAIYSYSEIPADTYPAIQPRGWFGGSKVKTVSLDALFVVNREWSRANRKTYEAILRGLSNAKPDIMKLVTPAS